MKTRAIGVVILNYIAYKETMNVTEQFLKLPSSNINLHIVIVDNHSNNCSFTYLSKKFKANKKVTVVQTDKNLGFANGNNFGYAVLVKCFKPDYVIFSNSDIVLKDRTLFEWIIENSRKHQFGILGPSVFSLSGNLHQNPCPNRDTNLFWNKKQLILLYLRKIKLYFIKALPFAKRQNNNNLLHKDWGDYTKYTENKTLHGSFLIMSQRYLKEYSTPFDTGTFLYMEEDILRIRCIKKSIPMCFSPEYEVNHKQAVSTKKVDNSEVKRKIIRINNEIHSLRRYIQILTRVN